MKQVSIRAGEQSVYTGSSGQTRRARVHVPGQAGEWRSVEMTVSVNLGTHPALRDLATTLKLHASDGLVSCYTLHDPAARKFCLVIPDSLRHRAIAERIALLQQLAAEDVALPRYVWELRTVVGEAELQAYLGEGNVAAKPATDAREEESLRARVSLVADKERAMQAEKQTLSVERTSLAAMRDELEVLRGDVELREQELEARLEMLREREIDLVDRTSSAGGLESPRLDDGFFRDESTNLVLLSELENPAEDEILEESDVEAELDDDELETELDDDEEIEEEIEDAEEEIEDAEEEIDEQVESLADDDEVEQATSRHDAVRSTGPTVVPPPGFLGDQDIEMVALAGDIPRLFARLSVDRGDAFVEGGELLVQLAMVQGYPVVLLALIESGGDRPYIRRAVLDPRVQDQRALLEQLKREFRARVALYSSDGRYLRSLELRAPREENVAAILLRSDASKDFGIDAQTAYERAIAVPPPVKDAHPFGVMDVGDARKTLSAIARVSAWSSDERRDRALFALSVPLAQIDQTFRSVGDAALRFGLAMSSSLRNRVIALGVAQDMSSLLSRQAEAFRALANSEDRGGLSLKEIAANWDALLAEAAEHEFPLDGETHAEAWEILRSVRGDTRTRASLPRDVDLAKLPDLGAPQLVMLLDHPKIRRPAAIELCRRADVVYARAVVDAMRKMSRPDVAGLAPHLARFGESVGDVLIDCMSARKTFVRQAAVLVLGHLKLRRALTPLVSLLATEESEIWRDVARVIGELGTAAVRPLAKLAKERKTSEDRIALALAHACLHGGKKQVQQLRTDEGESLATLVDAALLLEDEAKRAEVQARGGKSATGEDPVFDLSRKFYEELATLSIAPPGEAVT